MAWPDDVLPNAVSGTTPGGVPAGVGAVQTSDQTTVGKVVTSSMEATPATETPGLGNLPFGNAATGMSNQTAPAVPTAVAAVAETPVVGTNGGPGVVEPTKGLEDFNVKSESSVDSRPSPLGGGVMVGKKEEEVKSTTVGRNSGKGKVVATIMALVLILVGAAGGTYFLTQQAQQNQENRGKAAGCGTGDAEGSDGTCIDQQTQDTFKSVYGDNWKTGWEAERKIYNETGETGANDPAGFHNKYASTLNPLAGLQKPGATDPVGVVGGVGGTMCGGLTDPNEIRQCLLDNGGTYSAGTCAGKTYDECLALCQQNPDQCQQCSGAQIDSGAQTGEFVDCGAANSGCGQIDICDGPKVNGYCDKVSGFVINKTGSCGGGGEGGGSKTKTKRAPVPVCVNLKFYVKNADQWEATAIADLPGKVAIGEVIRIAAAGSKNTIKYARFSINGKAVEISTCKAAAEADCLAQTGATWCSISRQCYPTSERTYVNCASGQRASDIQPRVAAVCGAGSWTQTANMNEAGEFYVPYIIASGTLNVEGQVYTK